MRRYLVAGACVAQHDSPGCRLCLWRQPRTQRAGGSHDLRLEPAPEGQARAARKLLDRVALLRGGAPEHHDRPTGGHLGPADLERHGRRRDQPRPSCRWRSPQIQGLIAQGQIADIQSIVEDDDAITSINASLLDIATGPDGHLYGVPTAAYAVARHATTARSTSRRDWIPTAHRPPGTSCVRTPRRSRRPRASRSFGAYRPPLNLGGWMLAAIANGFRRRVRECRGHRAHRRLRRRRGCPRLPEGGPLGGRHVRGQKKKKKKKKKKKNVLMTSDDARQAFAADQMAQWITPTDPFNDLVTNRGMDPADIGFGPLPQDRDGIGTLAGGAVNIFPATATPAQLEAGSSGPSSTACASTSTRTSRSRRPRHRWQTA